MGETFQKPQDRQSAYQDYKELRGKPIIEQIDNQRELLKEKNDLLKNFASKLTDMKAEAEVAQNALKSLNARDDEKDLIEGQ